MTSYFLPLSILFFPFFAFANSYQAQTNSTTFPKPIDADEFATLSKLIYDMKSCDHAGLPSHVKCHAYIEKDDGAHVMVASSDSKKYVTIVYEGTDTAKDWINDFDITLTTFGPVDDPIADVKVHEGFNNYVFNEELFDELQLRVKILLEEHPSYRLILTGHSLGAANSILSGAAMAHNDPILNVTVLNYGCPRTGDNSWKSWVNELDNLGVWRFVYKNDIVPRTPSNNRFYHVGHTVQLEKGGAKAYYLHYGDNNLGYNSVPRGWEAESLSSHSSTADHSISNYRRYLKESVRNPRTYYIQRFVKAEVLMESDLNVSVVS